jgi:hypothetical protein
METKMPEAPLAFEPRSREITKGGAVVGVTDRIYDLPGKDVVFEEVLVRGDLSGDLNYNGRTIRVVRVDAAIGLLVDDKGARGPVWKGVNCEVLT